MLTPSYQRQRASANHVRCESWLIISHPCVPVRPPPGFLVLPYLRVFLPCPPERPPPSHPPPPGTSDSFNPSTRRCSAGKTMMAVMASIADRNVMALALTRLLRPATELKEFSPAHFVAHRHPPAGRPSCELPCNDQHRPPRRRSCGYHRLFNPISAAHWNSHFFHAKVTIPDYLREI